MKLAIGIVLLLVCVVNVDSSTGVKRVDPSVRICGLTDCSARLLFWDLIQAQAEQIRAQTEKIQAQGQQIQAQGQQIQAQGQQIRAQGQQIQAQGQQIQAQGKQIQTQGQQIQAQGQQIQAQGQQIQAQGQQIEILKKQIELIWKQLSLKPCPSGFEFLPETSQCVKLVPQRRNWNSAREACRGHGPGAKLAAITNHAKQVAVTRYLQKEFAKPQSSACLLPEWSQGGKTVWTSGQTKDPSRCVNFVWKPRPSEEIGFTYTNWSGGEPSCISSGEHCVLMASGIGFRWNDGHCYTASCFVCEI